MGKNKTSKMGNCLLDYVGIKVCADQQVPSSGLYINSLPGITLESMDKTATEDQITYLELWADVQSEAWIRFVIDFREVFSRCFDLSCVIDYEDIICDNKKILINAWRFLLGNQLMLFRINTTRLNRFSLVDAEEAQKLADYYQATYENALEQAVKLLDLSEFRQLHADPRPKQVTWLP